MASDHETIRTLCHTYAFLNDEADWDKVGELLGRGRLVGVVRGEKIVLGVSEDEIRESYATTVQTYKDGKHVPYKEGTTLARHLITNLTVTVAEDRSSGSARSYFTVMQCPPGLPLGIIVTGQYFDSFARDDENGWHFVEKIIQVDFMNDISHHDSQARFS